MISKHEVADQMPEPFNGPTGGRLVPVWLAIGVVFACLIGTGAGTLAWLNGDKVPAAVLSAGGAFLATVTLVILIISLFSKGS
jgi:hypothetical protein